MQGSLRATDTIYTSILQASNTINGLTLTSAATGFTIAGGTTSKTLTVSANATINAPTQWGIVYGGASGAYTSTAAGTSGQYLKSNGSAAPTWATFGPSTVGLGNVTNDAQIKKSILTNAYDMIYASSANTPARLAPNTALQKKFLTMTGTGSAGAAPSWEAITPKDMPYVTPEQYYSGSGDYTTAIQAAFDAAFETNPSDPAVVFSPGKIYNVSSTIRILGRISVFGNGATIQAISGGTFSDLTNSDNNTLAEGVLLVVQSRSGQNQFPETIGQATITNLTIDCNNIAKTGMFAAWLQGCIFHTIDVCNFVKVGIKTYQGMEMHFQDIRIGGAIGNSTQITNSKNAIGIDINSNDSVFEDVITKNIGTAIRINGLNNFYSKIHSWNNESTITQNSIMFDFTDYANFLGNNIYIDTVKIGFNLITSTSIKIQNQYVLHGGSNLMGAVTPVIFNLSNASNAQNIECYGLIVEKDNFSYQLFNVAPTTNFDWIGNNDASILTLTNCPIANHSVLRTYAGSANNEYPLLAQNSSANATSAWTAYTSSYKDYYGVIPNSDTTRATINLSTGKISIPGGLTVGKSTQSVAPTTGITVHDVTNATITPNIMSQSANFIFTNNNTPDIGFYSGLHMRGGASGDYAAWELIGPANTGDFGNEHLYVRCSKNANTWGNFRQIYDSDSTIPYTNGGTGLTTLGTAGTVLKVNDAGTGLEWGTVTGTGNGNAKIFYGTCSTGATTAAKVVECAEFDTVNDFIPGCMISVFFIYKNTAASENLTLSIGSNNTYTAGKPIRESYANLDNLQYIHNTALASGSIITFIYNGNEWQLIGSTNSVYQGPLVSECVYQSDGNGSGAIITAGGLYAGKITRIGPDVSAVNGPIYRTPSVSDFGQIGLIVNGPAHVGGTLTFKSLKLAGASSTDKGKVLMLNENGGFDLENVSSGSGGTSGVAITTTSNLYYLTGYTSTSGAPTTLYCNQSVYVNGNGYLYAPRVYNAVWNDYAECRKTLNNVKYGQCVIDKDDGSLEIASQRLMPGAQIVSDTWGNIMGETETTKTPIAVAGRVLAYPYRSRDKYHAGMAVCSAPNGTIDIMTREEIQKYPDCIIGIVSEIPNYEVWGSGNVKVDGRIWIKIK